MLNFKKIIVLITFFSLNQAIAATSGHHHSHHSKGHSHSKPHFHAKTQPVKHNQHKSHHHNPYTVGMSGFIPTTECRDPASMLDSSDIMPATPSKEVATFVDQTVSNLRYSSYKLGGKRFDPKRGVYVLDCSNFVDHVLKETSPNAYTSLVNATGADTPASFHYYNFFRELSYDADNYWSQIKNVQDLRAGDILVFRYKNRRGLQTGGHVMVVMNKPIQEENVYLVRVADSAPTRHSEDTRPSRSSGIGIGTLVLKANSKTGEPSAFAWGLDGYWNKNVNIAMARPINVG